MTASEVFSVRRLVSKFGYVRSVSSDERLDYSKILLRSEEFTRYILFLLALPMILLTAPYFI